MSLTSTTVPVMNANDQYNYSTAWSEDDQEWVGRCDAFESLSWLEPDRRAALDGIRALIAEVLETLDEDGIAPPPGTRVGTS